MILLIDNYDSFTYNLFQLIETRHFKVKVCLNDQITLEEINGLNPDKIVISPGPKTPDSTGICVPAIKAFHHKIPIMGICLGHQCIGSAFGAGINQARQLIHGQAIDIFHRSSRLFAELPNPFPAARYHSLVIDHVPPGFVQTGWDANHDIMAIEHTEFDLFGIQFHPESFMTVDGKHIVQKFLNG
jgi:anthranilate synthase component 2